MLLSLISLVKLSMIKKITEISWIAVSQFAVLIVNLILLKIVTQELSIADYGLYVLYTTIILFFRQIIYDPFSMLIAKEVAINYQNDRHVISKFHLVNYAADSVGKSIFGLALLILIIGSINPNVKKNANDLFFCCFILLANGAQGVYLNILNSLRERKVAALFLITDTLLKLLIVVFFILFTECNATKILSAIAISSGLTFLLIRKYTENKYKTGLNSNFETRRLLFNYFIITMPILVPNIFNSFKVVGDKWILAAFIGLDELAAYNVLLQIGYLPIILIAGIAQTYLAPIIYEMCKDNKKKLIKFIVNLILIALILSALAGVTANLLSNLIFDNLVGNNYKPYSIYLPIFAIAAFISASSAVMQNVIFGYFDTRNSSAIILFSNIIGLLIVFSLTYYYSFIGAAAGLVLMGLTSLTIFTLIMCIHLSK
jgi:O-antigen/teichoic acid export membrane protein